MDDASHQTGAGVGLQLKAPIGKMIEQVIRLGFHTFNNEIEYEAIMAEVNLAKSVSLEKLIIRSNSQLVAGQVNGEYKTQDQRMVKYVNLVKQRLGIFAAWKLKHTSWDSNEKVDALAVVSSSILIREIVFLPIYYQLTSSIMIDQVSKIDEESSSWLTPIMRYLSSGEFPDNRIEAHKIQVQAARFFLVNGQLYKRSVDGPYLKCLTTQ